MKRAVGGKSGLAAQRGVALLAGVCAALGGPVAQFLRLEEVKAPKAVAGKPVPAPQYRIVFAGPLRDQAVTSRYPATPRQEPGAQSREQDRREQPPRVLKPLAEHWKLAGRVELQAAESPAPAAPPKLLPPQDPEAAPLSEPVRALSVFCGPPGRGPPAPLS